MTHGNALVRILAERIHASACPVTSVSETSADLIPPAPLIVLA